MCLRPPKEHAQCRSDDARGARIELILIGAPVAVDVKQDTTPLPITRSRVRDILGKLSFPGGVTLLELIVALSRIS